MHSTLLEFNAFDNPMQLSKVGNWVITFLSPAEQMEQIELALTYVVPRQVSALIQPRRIVIQQYTETQWMVQQIECYDSQIQKDLNIEIISTVAEKILMQLIEEFAKYDVEVHLVNP